MSSVYDTTCPCSPVLLLAGDVADYHRTVDEGKESISSACIGQGKGHGEDTHRIHLLKGIITHYLTHYLLFRFGVSSLMQHLPSGIDLLHAPFGETIGGKHVIVHLQVSLL